MIYTIQYLAGFFDGEGHASLCVSKRPQKNGMGVKFEPKLGVCNNDLRPVLVFKQKWGGNINVVTSPSGKSVYRWQLAGRHLVTEFLNDIEPHVVVKKEQIRILMRFFEELLRIREGKHKNEPYTKESQKRLIQYRLQLDEAKQTWKPYTGPLA